MNSALQSNTDAILVGIPMLCFLFAGVFQIDKVLSKPKKPPARGHQLTDWDGSGTPVCVEPDGKTSVP
jgi:hypothetical protein